MAITPAEARCLANPSSLDARKQLAAELVAKQDPRGDLVDKQLRYQQHRINNTLWSDEANACDRETYVLLKKHGKQWAASVAPHVAGYEFHRGLIAEVTLPASRFDAVMPKLVELAPIQHVNLTAPIDLPALLASPWLSRIISLALAKLRLGDEQAAVLAGSGALAHLSWLSVVSNAIGETGAKALAASPHLANVAFLDLAGNPVNPTPFLDESDGVKRPGRNAWGDQLAREHGERRWLMIPDEDESWPPHRDDIALTP